MKMVKSFEDSGLLIKRVCETVENEVKEQKERFLSMLAATRDDLWVGTHWVALYVNGDF